VQTTPPRSRVQESEPTRLSAPSTRRSKPLPLRRADEPASPLASSPASARLRISRSSEPPAPNATRIPPGEARHAAARPAPSSPQLEKQNLRARLHEAAARARIGASALPGKPEARTRRHEAAAPARIAPEASAGGPVAQARQRGRRAPVGIASRASHEMHARLREPAAERSAAASSPSALIESPIQFELAARGN
jgi:hypothetical protein